MAFSLLVVATLTLGVSANTASFSVLHGILLRPLAYEDPATPFGCISKTA